MLRLPVKKFKKFYFKGLSFGNLISSSEVEGSFWLGELYLDLDLFLCLDLDLLFDLDEFDSWDILLLDEFDSSPLVDLDILVKGGFKGGFYCVLFPGPTLPMYDFFENMLRLVLKFVKKLKKFLFLFLLC